MSNNGILDCDSLQMRVEGHHDAYEMRGFKHDKQVVDVLSRKAVFILSRRYEKSMSCQAHFPYIACSRTSSRKSSEAQREGPILHLQREDRRTLNLVYVCILMSVVRNSSP